MLISLMLCLLMQVPDQPPDFSAFQYEQSQPKVEPKKPETVYFFGMDKFGRRWKCLSKTELENRIQDINQLPWEMVDDDGVVWQNQDPNELQRFVKQRNDNKKATQEFMVRWNTYEQKLLQPNIVIQQTPTITTQQTIGSYLGVDCSPGGS